MSSKDPILAGHASDGIQILKDTKLSRVTSDTTECPLKNLMKMLMRLLIIKLGYHLYFKMNAGISNSQVWKLNNSQIKAIISVRSLSWYLPIEMLDKMYNPQ